MKYELRTSNRSLVIVWLTFVCCSMVCQGAGTLTGKGQLGLVPCTAPAITGQPASLSCLTNATTNFVVTATGTGLTYQWRTNGVNVGNGTQFSGATAATLVVSNAAIAQSNTPFDCKIVGTCGSVTSSVATLTVTNGVPGGGGNGLLTGLVAVWEMEAADASNQTDATGNGKTLTQHGSPTQSGTHIQGTFATATGGSIYYDTSDAAFNITGNQSLAMWLNPNGSTPDSTYLATRWNSGHAWAVLATSGVFTFYVRNAADNANFTAVSTTTIGTSGWHLLVLTFNSSTKLAKISVDGETLKSSAATDGINTISENFTLTALSGGGGGFPGLTDETAFWTQELTQAQINALWNSGAGFFYSGGGWN